ncbi:MAG: FAD-dependent oxidoreductase, partial [Desulfobulbaceae bacterium]
MKRDLNQLQNRTFNLLVVGGGITGACIAHDAALRGLSVALVERQDFGMSTSAASSKLLHGGIRYLQKLQVNKVRESARERTYFQIIAPHITSNIPFMVPTEKSSFMKGKLAMVAGMSMYRLICSGLNQLITDPSKKIPFGKLHSKEELLKHIPLLSRLDTINGAHTLYETHMYNSERMTLAFLKTAAANGGVVANHTE